MFQPATRFGEQQRLAGGADGRHLLEADIHRWQKSAPFLYG
jgi:hypothetical protein